MNRRLARLTGGYFVAIGIIVLAVLPFALDALRIETANGIDRHLTAVRSALHRESILAIVALLVAGTIAALTAIAIRRRVCALVDREERSLQQRNSFTDVHRLSATLARLQSTGDIANVAAHEARTLLGATDVHVWIIGERERLHLVGSTDTLAASGSAPSILALNDANAPADAVRRNETLVFDDREDFVAAYPGWSWALDVQGAKTLVVLPTRSERDTVGVLEVFYDTAREIDELAHTVFELTADQVGNALRPIANPRARARGGRSPAGKPPRATDPRRRRRAQHALPAGRVAAARRRRLAQRATPRRRSHPHRGRRRRGARPRGRDGHGAAPQCGERVRAALRHTRRSPRRPRSFRRRDSRRRVRHGRPRVRRRAATNSCTTSARAIRRRSLFHRPATSSCSKKVAPGRSPSVTRDRPRSSRPSPFPRVRSS